VLSGICASDWDLRYASEEEEGRGLHDVVTQDSTMMGRTGVLETSAAGFLDL
jgi:hypothetical protein